jgi:hypothetical protein
MVGGELVGGELDLYVALCEGTTEENNDSGYPRGAHRRGTR